jgi:hypothetical protein
MPAATRRRLALRTLLLLRFGQQLAGAAPLDPLLSRCLVPPYIALKK